MTSTSYSEVNETLTVTSLPAVKYVELAIENALVLYVLPVIIIVGTLGNVTSFVVLVRSRMYNSSSVYLFLLLLAVADTLVLYVSGFKTWIRLLTNFELMNASSLSCKLITFLIILCQHLAAWIVVLVTVDRFVAVWFPLRASYWCTTSRAWIATLICTLAIVTYSLHVFWTFDLQLRRGKLIACFPVKVGEHVPSFLLGSFQLLILFTYCIIPFSVILALNTAIIVRLRWTSPALQTTTTTTEVNNVDSTTITRTTSNRSNQQMKVTYMLLTVSTTWILLSAPYGLYSLIVQRRNPDPHQDAIHRLAKSICFLLMYTNHAVNFFLYCVTGRKFRRELCDLFGHLCLLTRTGRRWLVTTSSVKTLRSNFVELEPLNETSRVVLRHQHYVTDDVTAVLPRDSVHDVQDSTGKPPEYNGSLLRSVVV